MNKRTTISALVLSFAAIAAFLSLVGSRSNTNGHCGSDGAITRTPSAQGLRSYCLSSDVSEKIFMAGTPSHYSFSILDDRSRILKGFAITHTKPMHVIVVRKDLAYFQHIHPEFDPASGVFTLPDLTFPADGTYRLFADFALEDTDGEQLPVTISDDVQVGSPAGYAPVAIGSQERSKTFSGIQAVLSTMPETLVSGMESMITFSLTEGGRPVTDLEEYLGALGHSVILREETLDFIHAHPMEKATQDGNVRFMVSFPQASNYKVFTQFQREGEVFTTDFVIPVGQGTLTPGMDHSMH